MFLVFVFLFLRHSTEGEASLSPVNASVFMVVLLRSLDSSILLREIVTLSELATVIPFPLMRLLIVNNFLLVASLSTELYVVLLSRAP